MRNLTGQGRRPGGGSGGCCGSDVGDGAAAAEAAAAELRRGGGGARPGPLGLKARLPASPEPAGALADQRLPYECVTGCHPPGARRTLAGPRRLRLQRRW